MTDQLEMWQNSFGNDYTDRNNIDWQIRLPAFRHMLGGLNIKRVLEVGCNRGHNLIALDHLLGDESDIVGVEPNKHALHLARSATSKVGFLYGTVFDIPFKDRYFDLVFTAGVLIHIPLDNLAVALNEIYRVSKQYILAIEYFAEEETTVYYRGYDNLLFKRDFFSHYQNQFPDLKPVRNGYLASEDGFDRCHWWLFEKASS
ncbi:MAG: pseudaminic acid biosynthesis-associated methylase [Chloroflexus sp.]|uniref:pseudaminic acid biosynthesis-associated methylase n=1 Tax=Chloroflexus sp. TaxID=1904827 RepID=UPI00404AE70E